MQPLKARVHHGRLILDEPTDPPEGSGIMLAIVDDTDDMDDAERARLHEALQRSMAQVKAGEPPKL